MNWKKTTNNNSHFVIKAKINMSYSPILSSGTMIEKAGRNKRTMTLIKFNKNANRNFAPVFPSLLKEMMEDLHLNNGGTALPAVNISESEKGFHIDLSIPGFGKEEITISLDENNLKIAGEKKTEKVDLEKRFTRKEFSYQNFKRSFTLPENINEEAIAAKFENGILSLELPKKEHNQKVSRKIELQ